MSPVDAFDGRSARKGRMADAAGDGQPVDIDDLLSVAPMVDGRLNDKADF
jgi:hypothetical protein